MVLKGIRYEEVHLCHQMLFLLCYTQFSAATAFDRGRSFCVTKFTGVSTGIQCEKVFLCHQVVFLSHDVQFSTASTPDPRRSIRVTKCCSWCLFPISHSSLLAPHSLLLAPHSLLQFLFISIHKSESATSREHARQRVSVETFSSFARSPSPHPLPLWSPSPLPLPL